MCVIYVLDCHDGSVGSPMNRYVLSTSESIVNIFLLEDMSRVFLFTSYISPNFCGLGMQERASDYLLNDLVIPTAREVLSELRRVEELRI